MTGPRSLLAALGLAALVACAAIADIDPLQPANGGGNDGGGSLPPTPDGIVVSPATIELETACNTAAERTISINNGGDKESSWEVRVPEGDLKLRDPAGALVSELKGTVAPGRVAQVQVTLTSAKPGAFSLGEVVVVTNATTQLLPINATVRGGAISLTPALVDFGEVREKRESPAQDIEIKNTGNEPVNVTGFKLTSGPPDQFSFDSGSVLVPPGESRSVSAKVEPAPADAEPFSAEYGAETQDPLCSAPPGLTLKAQRVSHEVTVNPGNVDFGDVECNSSPGNKRDFVVSNFSAESVTVSFEAPDGSWFVPPPTGTVAKGSIMQPTTATFTVGLKPVGLPGDAHTETLTVKIQGEETVTRTVTARVKVVGAIVEVSPSRLAGFSPGAGKDLSLRNVGNDEIVISQSSSNDAFQVTGPFLGVLAPNVPNLSRVTMKEEAVPPQTGLIKTTRVAAGKLCNSVPDVEVTTEP